MWDRAAIAMAGRSAELERIDTLLDGLDADGVPAVLDIAGEPGIGKSRLLGEVCARARARGLTVLRGRATEYERYTPFQTFTDAFCDADFAALDRCPAVARAAPVLFGVSHAGEQAPDSPGLDRIGLHRAVAAVLARLGGGGLVVALDDLTIVRLGAVHRNSGRTVRPAPRRADRADRTAAARRPGGGRTR